MFDLAVVVPGPGRLQLKSESLFANTKNAFTESLLSCVLESDPAAQVALQCSGGRNRVGVLEIQHSQGTATKLLRNIAARLRGLAGEHHVADGLRNGSRMASHEAHAAAGNDGASLAHPQRVIECKTVRAEPLQFTGLPLFPDRRGVIRLTRYGTHATSWSIVHEVPGRLRLKHPALYRRKEVCQAIERELMSVLGVDHYVAKPSTGTLVVKYDQRKLRKDQVLSILDRALSKAEIPVQLDPLDLDFPLAIISVPISVIGQYMFPVLLPAAGALFAYNSITTYKEAYKVLIHERRLGVDVLDAIVVTGCLATGQVFAGSVLCLCLSFGRMLVKKTQDDSKRLLVQAFGKQAQFVRLYKDGQEIETALEDLDQGDIIVVCTGETVPVDGFVKDGMAMIDQHALTGESSPAEKSPGDRVFASTLAVAGKIFIEVEKAGTETASSKIAQILNDSAGYKLDSQNKGERMADRAVIPTLGIAGLGLAALGPQGAVAVLNSDFGTGIRMAAPLAMLSSLALCAHKGILVKDGRALELMHEIDTVLFDKTGTLTRERPEVGQILTYNGFEKNRLLQLVASAEQRFSHPIAKAIVMEFEATGLPMLDIDDSKYQVGYGIDAIIDGHKVMVGSLRYLKMEGIEIPAEIDDVVKAAHHEGHTLVMNAVDGKFAGAIELVASQRPEVADIIQGLRDRGIKHIAIISGDHEAPTRKLAMALGMDEYFAGVLPGDKADYVERLQKQGRKVCFVGDGINDSIALKKANVSISLRGASSIATDTAQIVFMEESLHRLCELRDVAHNLDRNVRNSWYLILAPNVFCILGAFTMGFGIMASVLTNNVAALAALANGMLPLKKIAEEQAAKEAQNELAAAMAGSFGGGHMQPTAPRKETIVVEHRELATAGV